MEGQGPTPSRTHWCSSPSPRPVTVTLNAGRASTLPGASMEKWGEEHAQLTHQCLHCARLQGAGWVPFDATVLKGQSLVSTAQGFAFLSAWLLSIIVSPFSYFITLEITCQNINVLSVHCTFWVSEKDTVLMHKMLFCVWFSEMRQL